MTTNSNNSIHTVLKKIVNTGGGASAKAGAQSECSIDFFISHARDLLERHGSDAVTLRSVRGKIEELMSKCPSDEDAICLLIFRDCYIARLEEEVESRNKF